MSDALRELAAIFEVSFDPKGELAKGDKAIDGLVGTLKEAGKIFLEAFAIDQIKEFVMGQVEAALTLDHTANRMGIATEKLEEYQLAAGLSGVSTEEFNFSLTHLSRTIGEAAAKGGESAEIFNKLGVKLKGNNGQVRDSGDIFEDLAEKISKLPTPAEKSRVAFELFGRQGARLLPLLNKGAEGFAEARKAMAELGGPTSKEFIENSKKIEESQVRLRFVWNNVSQAIAATFLPKIIKVIDYFMKMGKAALDLNKNTHILTTGLMVLSAVAIAKLITQLGALAEKAGITGIRTALAFAGPIIVAGLLYLAFDEIYTLLNGGDTIVGRAADAFLGFGGAQEIAEDLRDTWQVVLNILEAIGKTAGDVATALANLPIPNVTGMGAEGGEVPDAPSFIDPEGKTKTPDANSGPVNEKAATERNHALADLSDVWSHLGAGTHFGQGRKTDRDRGANGGNWVNANGGNWVDQAPPQQGPWEPGKAAFGSMPAPGAPSLTVNQEMYFQNPPGDPGAVGKAAKSGVADAHQRGNYHAATAAAKP